MDPSTSTAELDLGGGQIITSSVDGSAQIAIDTKELIVLKLHLEDQVVNGRTYSDVFVYHQGDPIRGNISANGDFVFLKTMFQM